MTTMINVTLSNPDAWTLVASGPIANILISGPSNGWRIAVGSAAPADSNMGMAVSSLDGAIGLTALDSSDNVYARPNGAWAAAPIQINGMKN